MPTARASDHGDHAATRVTLIASAGTVACLTGPMLIGLLAARTGLLDALLAIAAGGAGDADGLGAAPAVPGRRGGLTGVHNPSCRS